MFTKRALTFNLFTPVWIALAIWCAATGRASWWVVVLIALSGVKIEAKYTFPS